MLTNFCEITRHPQRSSDIKCTVIYGTSATSYHICLCLFENEASFKFEIIVFNLLRSLKATYLPDSFQGRKKF